MKKSLLLILGSNGVGKSSTSQAMLNMMPHSAIVDGDWCRAMNPYNVETVIENIYSLMKNYLLCPDIDTVIFPYGFHGDRKHRFEVMLDKLYNNKIEFNIITVVLTCSVDENIKRMKNDSRDDARIQRVIENTYHLYDEYDCVRIDTTDLTITQTAEKVMSLCNISI